jgi:DNA replication initiation complex subunit (GINS family)
MEISYSVLREIQKKEMGSTKIVALDSDFYTKASEFIEKKRSDAFSSGSTLQIREYENIKKIIHSIKERREEKIVLMAIRGEETHKGLTPEEEELLREFSDSVNRFRKKVTDMFFEEEKPVRKNLRKVKLLKDVDPYKGLDDNVYGPFKSGEEIELPPSEAEWLLKAKLAESV